MASEMEGRELWVGKVVQGFPRAPAGLSEAPDTGGGRQGWPVWGHGALLCSGEMGDCRVSPLYGWEGRVSSASGWSPRSRASAWLGQETTGGPGLGVGGGLATGPNTVWLLSGGRIGVQKICGFLVLLLMLFVCFF